MKGNEQTKGSSNRREQETGKLQQIPGNSETGKRQQTTRFMIMQQTQQCNACQLYNIMSYYDRQTDGTTTQKAQALRDHKRISRPCFQLKKVFPGATHG